MTLLYLFSFMDRANIGKPFIHLLDATLAYAFQEMQTSRVCRIRLRYPVLSTMLHS